MARRSSGFTLIELLVVFAMIGLLLSIVLPNYLGGVTRAEEAVLRENLTLLRDALDKHYGDTGRYPNSLEELVARHYLRRVPDDPITGSATTWVLVPPANQARGTVFDVRSGAKGTGRDGKSYAQW